MDCLDGLQQLDDYSVDLIVTDPPYNFIAHGAGFITKAKKEYLDRVQDGFGNTFNPEPFLKELPRLMEKMNLYVWCSKNLIPVYLNWALDNDYFFDVLTWHKRNPVPLWNNKYISDTEYLIFIKSSGAYFNSNLGSWKKYRKYFVTNIGTERNGHPSPKPLLLMKNPIEVSSRKGDVVLDPYIGSGTTAVACRQLDRHFIAFEINPDYIKIANKRLMNIPKCLEYFVREDTNVSC